MRTQDISKIQITKQLNNGIYYEVTEKKFKNSNNLHTGRGNLKVIGWRVITESVIIEIR